MVCKTIGSNVGADAQFDMKRKGSDVNIVCTIKINGGQPYHKDPGMLVN